MRPKARRAAAISSPFPMAHPNLVVIGEMKQSFTLELESFRPLIAPPLKRRGLARCRPASKRGRGRENDAAREEALSISGFGLPHRHRRRPGGRGGGASAMEAEARRQTAFAHRPGASSPQGGSHHGRFDPDATNDGLSSAGARRGERACQHVESSAGPSDTCSGRRQNPSGQCCSWLVRAGSERGLYPLTSSRRIAHVTGGDHVSAEASARFGGGPTPERMV